MANKPLCELCRFPKSINLTVLLEKEFGEYYEIMVSQKNSYALLEIGTTTVKVQSSMKEPSQIGLKSPQALSKVVSCQDLSSSLYWTE